MRRKPDCLACGACCVATHDQEAFCDVEAADIEKLGRSWAARNVLFSSPFDMLLSALDGSQAPYGAIKTRWTTQRAGPLKGLELCSCIALKGAVMHAVKCSVYEKRPHACHIAVIPGDRTCIDIRRMFADAAQRCVEER